MKRCVIQPNQNTCRVRPGRTWTEHAARGISRHRAGEIAGGDDMCEEAVRRGRTLLSVCLISVALMAMASVAMPSSAQADEPRSFVLRVGSILPVSPDLPWEIESGVIVVRDGKITAIGTDVSIPLDLPLIELADATVMPGFVAAATSMAPRHRGDESIAAGYRAVDSYLPYIDYGATLASGVSTVHLSPGEHRLLTGQGAVVRLGGALAERVLIDAADLTLNFGEAAFGPPKDVNYHAPSSPDVAIPPGVRQRPDSRLGQVLAIEEALARGEPLQSASFHGAALVNAWRSEKPLRIQIQRGADIHAAIEMMKRHQCRGYLVGAAEADVAVDAIVDAKLPVVYRVGDQLRGGARNIGFDPDSLDADISMLSALTDVKLALAGPKGAPVVDLRLAAATALRAGLSRRRVIEAITRVPAEILGIADRVGSLTPGMEADLIVLTGDPLATTTHVRRVYIGGALAFQAPESDALVVRAGTVWVSEEKQIHDGAVLVEKGKIVAVGSTVPHPPFARFIDAGKNAFVTPGFIDAHGHLGFGGDRTAVPPELSPARIIGVPDVTDRRVALAGITTVLVSSYAAASQGSQVAAVKTGGLDVATDFERGSRVVRETAGVVFNFAKSDAAKVGEKLRKRLDAAKKYAEKWTKYEKDLAEWKEKKAKGEKTDGKPKTEVVEEAEEGADPITGTWATTVSGGPIPEPQTGILRMKLTGSDIEGYLSIEGESMELKLVATLDGTHISGHIEIEIGGGEYPQVEADITEEDHIVGTISFQGLKIDLDATRTDKAPVEFKVVKRKTRGKGGRPLPPKTDETLEPLRAALEKRIPIVVSVSTPAQINAVLKVAKDFEVPLVLRGAESASAHAESLVEQGVGVIVPRRVVRRVHNRPYHQADDLSRKGISIAFQSDGEDSARTLPLLGLHAVERGLSADAALAAMTTDVSRMFKIDDRIGSLLPGRDGDMVIFSGHPLEAGSRVERVIISGKEIR